jgi:hypothetical protein
MFNNLRLNRTENFEETMFFNGRNTESCKFFFRIAKRFAGNKADVEVPEG